MPGREVCSKDSIEQYSYTTSQAIYRELPAEVIEERMRAELDQDAADHAKYYIQ